MPRIRACLKTNTRKTSSSIVTLTQTRLAKTHLAMEQFKLARMEEDHAKKNRRRQQQETSSTALS